MDPAAPTPAQTGAPPSTPSPLEAALAAASRAQTTPGPPPPPDVPTRALVDAGWVRWSLWMAVAAWWLWPGLLRPHQLGTAQDWSYFTSHDWSAWLAVSQHGELPVWDAYACGGVPLLGNLQARPLGPTALLALLLGPWTGLRVAMWFHLVLAMEGAFRWTRHRGVAGVGGLVAGLAFACGGRMAQAVAEGQPGLLAFAYAPWALWALERSWRDGRAVVVGAVAMALLLYEGGAVPLPLTVVLLGAVTALRTAVALWRGGDDDVRWWRPAAALAAMGALALLLAAPRLLPVAESLLRWPRVWHGVDTYSLGHVVNMLWVRSFPGHHADDGASFVGPALAALAAVALLARDRRAIWPLALTLLLLDLATGRDDGLGLFGRLRSLPVLENLRHPMRFAVFVALTGGALAAIGVATVEHALWRRLAAALPRWRTGAAWLAALAALALAVAAVRPLLLFGRARVNQTFAEAPYGRVAPQPLARPFAQGLGNRWAAEVWPVQARGSLSCFEEQPFPQSPGLRADLGADGVVEPPEGATVTRLAWSPHRLVVDVGLPDAASATLVLNQNYHRGWTAGELAALRWHDGRLAVALPAATAPGPRVVRVAVRFADPLVATGLGLLAVTLLALAGWGWRRRRAGASAASRL